METLTFDAEKHEYHLGARQLPSVTTILKDVGLIDSTHFNDYAATRGSFVHQACEMLDLGTLDEDALDPVLVGYVAAYKKFCSEFDATWTEIEKPRHDAALGFAGCPDRVGDKLILDIKTGTAQTWHGFQLAAYSILAGSASSFDKRYGLYLSSEGTYKLKRYEDRNDFHVFRSALNIFHAKRNI